MTQMEAVGKLLKASQYRAALKLAKNWKMMLSEEQQSQIRRGYECFANPDFYRQIGFDPEQEKTKAVKTLQEVFDFPQVML